MATVTFDDLTRIYPKSPRPAVDGLSLEIADAEFLVLVGPSGCGKTTTLRMLAGLEHVDSGTILIDDEDVVKLAPRDRDIAMVFQNYALYPHMNVAHNMGFALRLARVPKHEIEQRVRAAAKILDLEDYLDRKPRQLSGGQRQRVAMGRAIVREPRVFLMDEPLSNLDAKLRVATRAEIAALQQRLGITTLYVTHDQVEAMTMGDRVAVMKDGVLQQCDTPRVLYDDPVNAFVAGFIGSPPMNLLDGVLMPDGIKLGSALLPCPDGLPATPGTKLTAGLRPEALHLTGSGSGLVVTVNLVEELGAEAFVHATVDSDAVVAGMSTIVARLEPRLLPAKGDRITLHPAPESMLFFDPTTGARIRVHASANPSSSV